MAYHQSSPLKQSSGSCSHGPSERCLHRVGALHLEIEWVVACTGKQRMRDCKGRAQSVNNAPYVPMMKRCLRLGWYLWCRTYRRPSAHHESHRRPSPRPQPSSSCRRWALRSPSVPSCGEVIDRQHHRLDGLVRVHRCLKQKWDNPPKQSQVAATLPIRLRTVERGWLSQ